MIILWYPLRALYAAAALGISITIGVIYGAGSANPLHGAAVADLILVAGWVWMIPIKRQSTR